MRGIGLALLLIAAPAAAQLHNHASGLAHGIPDFCALDPAALIIPAGQPRTLTGPLTLSCLGIHGTVTLDGTAQLKVETILVYDDGTLIVRSGAAIAFRDTPISLALDPEQYSHGLIGFGAIRIDGDAVTPFQFVTTDLHKGSTTITLVPPADWRVGHRLFVPDTRQRAMADFVRNGYENGTNQPVRLVKEEETCVVVALAATSLTCQAPFAFDHLGAHSPAVAVPGSAFVAPPLDLYPAVANLTRSVVLTSENPAGVRGHILVSQRATIDIRGAAFVDLGRTTGAPLNSTLFDETGAVSHIGTNQIARYGCFHAHHLMGPAPGSGRPYQFVFANNVCERPNKWGAAIHNSHFGLVQDNVCVGASGACYVTEDGSETGNTFDHNYASNVENPVFQVPTISAYDPEMNHGTGFWFGGHNNTVTRNVCFGVGDCLAFYTGNGEDPGFGSDTPRAIPNTPGADTTDPTQVHVLPRNRQPMGVVADTVAGNVFNFGLDFWGEQLAMTGPAAAAMLARPIQRTTLWHVADSRGGKAINAKYADIVVDGLTAINEGGVAIVAEFDNDAGAQGLGAGWSEFAHVDARGFDTGLSHRGQTGPPLGYRISDSLFQVRTGVFLTTHGESSTSDFVTDAVGHQFWDTTYLLRNVGFTPLLPRGPLTSIRTEYWGGDPAASLMGARHMRVLVRDHQKIAGNDFRVWFTGQAADAPAPFGRDPIYANVPIACPEPLTNQQCWTKYHIAAMHEPAPAITTSLADVVGLITPLDAAAPPAVPPGPSVPPTLGPCTYIAPGSTTVQHFPVGAVLPAPGQPDINQIATQGTRWVLFLHWGWHLEGDPLTTTTVRMRLTCKGLPLPVGGTGL